MRSRRCERLPWLDETYAARVSQVNSNEIATKPAALERRSEANLSACVPGNAPLDTAAGTVVLTGCGHAGIVNIAQYASTITAGKPLLAVVGSLHLFSASEQTVVWTGAKLNNLGLQCLLAGRRTGIEATYLLRDATGLSRKSAVVAVVGSSFTLGKGIDPRKVAQ